MTKGGTANRQYEKLQAIRWVQDTIQPRLLIVQFQDAGNKTNARTQGVVAGLLPTSRLTPTRQALACDARP